MKLLFTVLAAGMGTYGFIRVMFCLDHAEQNVDLGAIVLDLSVAAIAIGGALDVMHLVVNSS